MSLFRPPREDIEIDIKHPKLRIALVIGLIVIAAVSLGYGITGLLSTKTGWQEVSYVGTDNENAAGEFSLNVYLKGGFMDQSGKQLSALYSEESRKAYRIIDPETTYEGVGNLALLNEHPNEEVELDPALYDFLKKLDESGLRVLYLGPVYEAWRGLFLCLDDAETAEFDPVVNETVRDFIKKASSYANDPDAVSLEFYDGYKAKLAVSAEYQAFFEEENCSVYLDTYWFRNAFLADYLTDKLIKAGVNRGYLIAKDGFIRCFDKQEDYYLPLTSWNNGQPVSPTVLTYTGPSSFVIYRGFPLQDTTTDIYYIFRDGRLVNGYIDPKDGEGHLEKEEVVVYSHETDCTGLLKASLPAVLQGKDADLLEALQQEGIFAVFTEGGKITATDPDARFLSEK
ncbi:MAG: hypothetical protein IIY77_00625 [Lachnospiraceae bacterium]|nr:hypothetical protein [Lachnospiraceae bacterium]